MFTIIDENSAMLPLLLLCLFVVVVAFFFSSTQPSVFKLLMTFNRLAFEKEFEWKGIRLNHKYPYYANGLNS